ncbi:MAG: hypothetical protein ACREFP_10285 [Acetobacteraceae bacterium]
MRPRGGISRSLLTRSVSAWLVTTAALVISAGTAFAGPRILQGRVESNGRGLPGYQVGLYAAVVGGAQPAWRLLGATATSNAGEFRLRYTRLTVPEGLPEPLLFVEATDGPSMLASAIGRDGRAPARVVVDELTTVAIANAFAEFVHGAKIVGNTYGMINAVGMAANFANPGTGALGPVIDSSPNRTETSTLATFNSLANVVAGCVADRENCAGLFRAATPAGRQAGRDAAGNLARPHGALASGRRRRRQ